MEGYLGEFDVEIKVFKIKEFFPIQKYNRQNSSKLNRNLEHFHKFVFLNPENRTRKNHVCRR